MKKLIGNWRWIERRPWFRTNPWAHRFRYIQYCVLEKCSVGGKFSIKACGEHSFLTPCGNFSSMVAHVFGERDINVISFYKKVIRPGAVVVDVGANIGLYTASFSKIVGPDGLVIAFEAHPEIYKYLAKNIEALSHKNVSCEGLAVGSGSGEVKIIYVKDNPGETHIIRDGGADDDGIDVPMISIDSYLAERQISRVSCIKIDVEGFELSVLRGAQKVINNNPEVLVQTEWDVRQRSAYGDEGALIEFMQGMGFIPHLISADGVPEPIADYSIFQGEIIWSRTEL